jgi:hypothetical protein
MSKKKATVLKDFSQLNQQQRINLLALKIYQIQSVFQGHRERAFEPRQNTQVHSVWDEKHLSIRQQQGWRMFRQDFDNAEGKSGSVTASYGEQIGENDGSDFRAPVAYTNEAYRRIHALFTRFLDRREAALLHDLLQDDLRNGTDLKLEYIGLIRSGFTGEVEAKTAGIVHIQTLLDRLASYYGY